VTDTCDHALGDMALMGQPAGWPLELSRAKRWVQPGVALAGDAAHAMHPLAGQGLNVGLGDVAELARVLHEREYWRELGDLKLLRRYERARQADFAAMAWVTDGLFGLFGHDDSRLQALRRWGLRRFDRLTPLKHWAMRQAMG
jgi:2-polyprenyl-6-methoxyphenol hydroxylase-like FAD-dependent oxidoreductase